jgi:hypothetical protein
MSNKCIALAYVEDGDTSPYMHGYRMGVSAKLTNRYQGDTVDGISLREEQFFLPLFIKSLDALAADFQKKMGSPILPSGERKAVTIMVANEGVMDLVLNFLCSCRASAIDTKDSLVVFVGQPELAPVLEALGVTTFYSEALGPIPKKAATFYGDNVFGVLMWLKTTSLYVAARAGYDVLFQVTLSPAWHPQQLSLWDLPLMLLCLGAQDTDLVWMKDPLPTLRKEKHDIIFMDDGARYASSLPALASHMTLMEYDRGLFSTPHRTPRFTPLYVNSGFYFQKHNERTLFLMEKMMKSISEIAVTHSHQATLTRHITEAHHLVGLQVSVLSQEDFPSGIVFHHDKAYIERMQKHLVSPTVFHMCWTTSREEKVMPFAPLCSFLLSARAVLIGPCCLAGHIFQRNRDVVSAGQDRSL